MTTTMIMTMMMRGGISDMICGFIMDVKGGSKHPSYGRWRRMISRCYNENDKDYMYYGGNGSYVDDRWRLFSEFMIHFDNYYIPGSHLDKDALGFNCYGPDTAIYISAKENIAEATSRRDNSYLKGDKNFFYGTSYQKCGDENSNAKQVGHYAVNSSRRDTFMAICKNRDWNFDDFEEIFAEKYIKPSGKTGNKYYYKLKNKNTEEN